MGLTDAIQEEYDALFRACVEGKLEEVQALMKKRVYDLERKNKNGETLLMVATVGNHLEIIDFLLEKGADIEGKCTKYMQTPLLAAAFFSDLQTFQFLEARGADMTARDKLNADAFMRAVDASNLELMKYLLSVGEYDLERRNANGKTPWIKAARKTSIEVKKYLVELGANIHATDNYNLGAMALAAQFSDVANCQYLREIGVSSNTRACRGETVLHQACYGQNLETVKFLLDNGLVDVHATMKSGVSALDIAAKKKNFELLALLQKYAGESDE